MSETLIAITMPKWGLAMKEGAILQWLKNEGDEVKKGEILLEIETDKVVNEMESPEDGKLLKKSIKTDIRVPVGSLIAVYGNESISDEEIEKFISEFNENFVVEDDEAAGEANKYEKIMLGDIEINFSNIGEEKEKNILFIHGFGGDLNNWMFNQEELSKDYNTFAIDLPGHGQSSKNVTDGSLKNMAKIMNDFCSKNNISKINLVGHSYGAGIAIQAACDFKDLIESLTLISPIGLGKEIDDSYLEDFITSESRRDLKPVLEKLYANSEIITRDMVNEVLSYKRIDGVENSLKIMKDQITKSNSQNNELKDQLNALEIPVSIIWGKNDNIIPSNHTERLNEKISIEIIENCGHMAHTEYASKVNEIIKSTN